MLRRYAVLPLSLFVLLALACDSSDDSALGPKDLEPSVSLVGSGQVAVWASGQDAPVTFARTNKLTTTESEVQSVISPDRPNRLSADLSALYHYDDDIGILYDALANVTRRPDGGVRGTSSRTMYGGFPNMNPTPDDIEPNWSYSGPPACLEKLVLSSGNEAIVLAARLGEDHVSGWDATYDFFSLDGTKVWGSIMMMGEGVYEDPCSEEIMELLIVLFLGEDFEPNMSTTGRCTSARVDIDF